MGFGSLHYHVSVFVLLFVSSSYLLVTRLIVLIALLVSCLQFYAPTSFSIALSHVFLLILLFCKQLASKRVVPQTPPSVAEPAATDGPKVVELSIVKRALFGICLLPLCLKSLV